jgi:hypothetical protein
MIQGGGGGDDFSVDEASTISSHGGHYHRGHLGHHGHWPPRMIGPVDLTINGKHGRWNPEHHHDHHEHHETIRL